MKPISIRLHPLMLAGILTIAIPAIAIAAGTVLSPPVSVSGSSFQIFSATNTGTGHALDAKSSGGLGIYTQTNSAGASALYAQNNAVTGGTAINAFSAGVTIQSTSKLANGVLGVTTRNGSTASNYSAGVVGLDQSSSGVFNAGVRGRSANGVGVNGTSSNAAGVQGTSVSGVGVSATTISSALPALYAQAKGTGPAIIANNGSFDVMSLDNMGNMILYGSLTEFSTPLVITRAAGGQTIGTYVPTQSVPTIDDVGEAQLTNGRAFVPLDPVFAKTIDLRSRYLVFITPNGESHGLYVSLKMSTGFYVRENDDGRSTLTFDYRIVAKPYNKVAPRLPLLSRPQPNTAKNVSRLSPSL